MYFATHSLKMNQTSKGTSYNSAQKNREVRVCDLYVVQSFFRHQKQNQPKKR